MWNDLLTWADESNKNFAVFWLFFGSAVLLAGAALAAGLERLADWYERRQDHRRINRWRRPPP